MQCSLSIYPQAARLAASAAVCPCPGAAAGCDCASCARLMWLRLRGNCLQKESRIRRACDSVSAAGPAMAAFGLGAVPAAGCAGDEGAASELTSELANGQC